jgi:hypothetical protein
MIFWGSGGNQVDLGLDGSEDCTVCERPRPYRVWLFYRYGHVYWAFRFVTSKRYFKLCETCRRGWELDKRQTERVLGKVPIPFVDRFGWLFGVGVVAAIVLAGVVQRGLGSPARSGGAPVKGASVKAVPVKAAPVKSASSNGGGSTPSGGTFYRPYGQSDVNFVYNLLFCDDPELFRSEPGAIPSGPLGVLLSARPSLGEVRRIAEDASAESRMRILAYNHLRSRSAEVPRRQLLGVVVELPYAGGLDVVAAYDDGRLRYINHSEKMSLFEAKTAATEGSRKALMAAARAAIASMGPWDGKRKAPPSRGRVRLTFLVSDGLYFGEGPASTLEADPVGGPILRSTVDLMKGIVSVIASSPSPSR